MRQNLVGNSNICLKVRETTHLKDFNKSFNEDIKLIIFNEKF